MNYTASLQNSEVKRIPKYVRLAAKLREEIMSGKVKVGTCFPSQDRLVNQHNVALTTVRQAVKVLQDEGLLESVHGKGVYVRNADAAQNKPATVLPAHTIGCLFAGSPVDDRLNYLIQLDIQKHSRNTGVRVLFDAYFEDQAGEEQHISEWSKGLSGVILTGFIDEKLLVWLRKNVRHIVIIGGTMSKIDEATDISNISFDYESAMVTAVSFLAGFGHRRILGTVCSDLTLPVLYEAFSDGLMAAAQNANVCADIRNYGKNDMATLADEIVRMSEQPTAIICNGEENTYKLMTQLIMAGVKVPEQISMIAIGDARLIQEFAPRLTCIGGQIKTGMGVLAFEAVMRAIKLNVCTFQEVGGCLIPGETCIPVKLK